MEDTSLTELVESIMNLIIVPPKTTSIQRQHPSKKQRKRYATKKLLHLPIEILVLIFQYGSIKDIISFNAVCKIFKSVVDLIISQNICIHEPNIRMRDPKNKKMKYGLPIDHILNYMIRRPLIYSRYIPFLISQPHCYLTVTDVRHNTLKKVYYQKSPLEVAAKYKNTSVLVILKGELTKRSVSVMFKGKLTTKSLLQVALTEKTRKSRQYSVYDILNKLKLPFVVTPNDIAFMDILEEILLSLDICT